MKKMTEGTEVVWEFIEHFLARLTVELSPQALLSNRNIIQATY